MQNLIGQVVIQNTVAEALLYFIYVINDRLIDCCVKKMSQFKILGKFFLGRIFSFQTHNSIEKERGTQMKIPHRFILVLSLIMCIMATAEAGTNYCDPCLCQRGGKHVCCGQKGFDECCVRPKMVSLTEHQELILSLENDIRDTVASGRLKGYKPAKKMAAVSWCDKLGSVAACNCRGCKYGHDECHNTCDCKHVGQNIYMANTDNHCHDAADVIRAAHKFWIDEYKLINMKKIDNGETSGAGHFTLCCRESVTLMGCAMIQFWDEKKCHCYFVCNYNQNNMRREPVYVSGKTASDCKKGTHPIYSGLCNYGECYDDVKVTATATASATATVMIY